MAPILWQHFCMCTMYMILNIAELQFFNQVRTVMATFSTSIFISSKGVSKIHASHAAFPTCMHGFWFNYEFVPFPIVTIFDHQFSIAMLLGHLPRVVALEYLQNLASLLRLQVWQPFLDLRLRNELYIFVLCMRFCNEFWTYTLFVSTLWKPNFALAALIVCLTLVMSDIVFTNSSSPFPNSSQILTA